MDAVDMDIWSAINGRRSIRSFLDTPVPREMIIKILQAGIEAPSAKNSQPWRFVVVEDGAKADMLEAMAAGLERAEADPGFPDKKMLVWPRNTLRIMGQAPVTVFVMNPLVKAKDLPTAANDYFGGLSLTQSVGAAIQNMLLAAHALGLGSLWICDVFFSAKELGDYLGTDELLMAAVSLGYTEENPGRRGRKKLEDVVEWRA